MFYNLYCKIYDFFGNIYWWFYRLIRWEIPFLPLKIKRFYQRGRYGFSDQDMWSLNIYLANVISQSIKKLVALKKSANIGVSKKEIKEIKELTTLYLGFANYFKDIGYEATLSKTWEKRYTKAHKNLKKSFDLLFENFDNLWQ